MQPSHNVYLSPHLDDAAFSLGSLIASEPGGTLVNVFTRSAHVAGRDLTRPAEVAETDRVSALRLEEDRAFSERLGLARTDLGQEEPMLRGRHAFGKDNNSDSVALITPALFAALDAAVATGAGRIFCPAGIGRHRDHLAVRTVVLDWCRRREPLIEIWFYEDLPYASKVRARWRGLLDLRHAVGPHRLRRRPWLAGADKLDSINAYPSQHDTPVTGLRRFSPAALWPIGPHEAAWQMMK